MIDKFIFIVGTGRCGTTWLNEWLLKHPECFGGVETKLFQDLHPIVERQWTRGLQRWMKEESLIEECGKFCTSLYENAQQPGQLHVIDQSHQHYWYMDFISKVVPNSYFIHIYRDGRNVVESWLRVPRSKQWSPNIDDHIDDWMRVMNNMVNGYTPHRMLNIKYEDLIEHPERSREITSFLGLSHHTDVCPWAYPINTPNKEYDYYRWQRLSLYEINRLKRMDHMLARLEYSADGYYRKSKMTKKDVLEQLNRISEYIPKEDSYIVGSASLVLRNKQKECKDIDLLYLGNENNINHIPYPHKMNPVGRFYSELRLDLNISSSSASVLGGYTIKKALGSVAQKYHQIIDGWHVISARGYQISAFLFLFFVEVGLSNFQKCRNIELTYDEENFIKQFIKPVLLEKIKVRHKHMERLYASSRHRIPALR